MSSVPRPPAFPSAFPWVTYGRPESGPEFFSKWKTEADSAVYVAGQPQMAWVVCESETPAIERWTRASLGGQSYPNVQCLPIGGMGGGLGGGSGTFAERANRAARKTSAEWLGFLDGALVPAPTAAFQLLREAQAIEKTELVYANEAVVREPGLKLDGWLSKPRFSWATLAHFNYLGWSWLIRRRVFLELGGFAELSSDEAVHDLLLRFSERRSAVAVSSATLFYRFAERRPSFSSGFVDSLRAHLARRAVVAQVDAGESLRIRPETLTQPKVSVVTCFRNRSEWTIRCLDALEAQKGVDLEVILVDNQSSQRERAAIDARVASYSHPVRIVSHDGPFHFARMNNEAVRRLASHPLLFFLNNDVFLSGSDALLECARWAMLPEIGTVGMRLTYPNGRVQHDGIRAVPAGGGRLVRVGHFPGGPRLSRQTREVFANTFAACMFRRDVFEAAGGLSELDWVNGFGDIAFQLELLRRGYHHLFLGTVEAIHVESGSRGSSYEYWEEMTLERRFPELVEQMARADLAWHTVDGPWVRLRRAVVNAAADSLRAGAPRVLDFTKKALNALSGRAKIT